MKRVVRDFWETKETRAALILGFALMLSVIIFCFATRYQFAAGQRYGLMYDRITGKGWSYNLVMGDYSPAHRDK
jgi:hypothetical protein